MKFAFQEKWILARRSASSHAFEPERRAWPGREVFLKKVPSHARRPDRIVEGVPADRLSGQNTKGVALVITLILLAVIATLAIAFLALTYRETASVDAMGRTTDAELMVDSALEHGKGEILAPFPVRNKYFETNGPNLLGPDLIVSVCCQNEGLVPINRSNWEMRLDPTNYLNAAPPVFIDTNRPGQNGPIEDRFNLDLNRNDTFEESGTLPVIDDNGQVVRDPAGNVVTFFGRGDPQWIGMLQNPRRKHGPDNRFIGRYAFMVLPAGRTLDLNWIHNRAKFSNPSMVLGEPGFFRNQGVGGWEINLAAFFADLNPNIWSTNNGVDLYPYLFEPYLAVPNVANSTAFIDALELLRYRYNGSQARLDSIQSLFAPVNSAGLQTDLIDLYATNSLTALGRIPANDLDVVGAPWPGAESRQRFYSVHDLFDARKLPSPNAPQRGFRDHLREASTKRGTFGRYSFYRMLEQLGTDSVADEEVGKININYVNVAGIKATELVPWTDDPQIQQRIGQPNQRPDLRGSELFFLSAVTNLLARDAYLTNRFAGISLINTNPTSPGNLANKPLRIPIFLDGSRYPKTGLLTNDPYYSSRIHQILQQAANIYDATRGATDSEASPYYPSVFRPQYEVESTSTNFNVYIVNYKLVTESAIQFKVPNNPLGLWRDLELGERPTPTGPSVSDNGVYGIPWIVGARRGFPNFNEFIMESFGKASRRLLIRRTVGSTNIVRIDEIFSLDIANKFQTEIWNPYRTAFPRPMEVFFRNSVTNILTNSFSVVPVPTLGTNTGFVTPFAAGTFGRKQYHRPPPITNVVLSLTVTNPVQLGVGKTNAWSLAVRNRILCFLTEGERIVDAVSLLGTNAQFEIGRELVRTNEMADTRYTASVWDPRSYQGKSDMSLGIQYQLEISTRDDDAAASLTEWKDFDKNSKSRTDAAQKFREDLDNETLGDIIDVPFKPVRRMRQLQRWEVNDPLVHYTMEDLWVSGEQGTVKSTYPGVGMTDENARYVPWDDGGLSSQSPPDRYTSLRDSSIFGPDDWDFPTNKLPSVGWLGRVHRGTPWQTVYFKDGVAGLANWSELSGRMRSPAEAAAIHPTNDWRLADVFTSSIHPNATRGRLSINQAGLPAWSAVLAGVVASTVTNDPNFGPVHTDTLLEPSSVSVDAEVQNIVAGINNVRAQRTNQQFSKMSEIFSVPELTTKSPLLYSQRVQSQGFDSMNPPPGAMEVLDRDYERIPEQILSLLKVGEPRFVIYAWGQSLKPARLGVVKTGPNPENIELRGPSIVTGGDDKGLCNNYQITGELAIRAVVRVEFDRDPVTLTPDYRRPHAVVESYNIIPVE